jgi:thioredoxin reductase (NADPH)
MYDTIIIGAGPAGLTAGIYLARADKKVLILEKEGIGGQIASSPLVENYPGYTKISGADLTSNMYDQVDNLGVKLELEEVIKINDGKIKEVITTDKTYHAKSIIIATGSKYRTLHLPNEDNLIGNGIHFCVACDGAFYKNKDVAVIGGGNSATINALSLAKICHQVYVIQNMANLTSEATLQNELLKCSNVKIICNASVTNYLGTSEIAGLTYKQGNQEYSLKVEGIFLSIGLIPQNEIFNGILKLDKTGYIISNDCKTNIPGIFVAGDSRTKEYRQVTVAVSDGTIAALDTIDYLNKN